MKTNYISSDIQVFILTYNRAEMLRETLISVCNQSIKGFEIIVLDNASTDNTATVVKEFSDYGVVFNCTQKNIGSLGNFQRAQFLADKDYVMVFHDDDLMHPKYMEYALYHLNNQNNVVMLASKYKNNKNPKNSNWKEFSRKAILCNNVRDFSALLFSGYHHNFSSTIYKTEVFIKTIFSEKYGKIADRPFMIEISRYGKTIVLDNLFIKYRWHEGQDTSNPLNGPFVFQWFELMKLYQSILGVNFFNRYGRVYISHIIDHMKCGYNWTKTSEANEISFDAFIEKGVTAGIILFSGIMWDKIYSFKIFKDIMKFLSNGWWKVIK